MENIARDTRNQINRPFKQKFGRLRAKEGHPKCWCQKRKRRFSIWVCSKTVTDKWWHWKFEISEKWKAVPFHPMVYHLGFSQNLKSKIVLLHFKSNIFHFQAVINELYKERKWSKYCNRYPAVCIRWPDSIMINRFFLSRHWNSCSFCGKKIPEWYQMKE